MIPSIITLMASLVIASVHGYPANVSPQIIWDGRVSQNTSLTDFDTRLSKFHTLSFGGQGKMSDFLSFPNVPTSKVCLSQASYMYYVILVVAFAFNLMKAWSKQNY